MTHIPHRLSILLYVLLALVISPANAEPPSGHVTLDTSFSRLVLDENLLVLNDAKRKYHVGDVLESTGSLPWQSSGQDDDSMVLNSGGLYWFKVTLSNPLPEAVALILETEYPLINVADLYAIDAEGNVSTIFADAGLEDTFENRPILHPRLINNLEIPANSSLTLVWRIDSEPLLLFRASLWEPDSFAETDLNIQLMMGMVYGTLLVMLVYNLFLFLSTTQPSFFYFVAYLLTSFYLLASEHGHLYQYFAPDQIWAKLPIHGIIYSLNLLLFGQFTVCFLELKKRRPEFLWTIRTLTGLSIALSVAVLISSNITLSIIGSTTISLLYLAAIGAGIYVRKLGVVSAGYFVIAIMILALAMISSNMAMVGLIEGNRLTENLGAIGTTLMLVFFALALADRLNQLQRDIGDANKSLHKALEEKFKAELELNNSKQQRIKLEQSHSQAKRESQAKSDFLATLSHEIRTPMHGVLGVTELMKDTELDDQQTHYLNTIEHSGKALLSIINDLQDFAKIEAGKLELEVLSFNLETLVDDCISTFALRAVEKNINFLADLDPEIDPVLRGDPTKLQQVILNLLSNAFKFTEHGDILLVIRSTGKPAVNSVELKIEVHDSGIGLTEEEQQRLFTPFQHVDESTYGRYGGSGLGLAISKQLVELMDGEIGVNSIAGEGSCFWFTARLLTDEQPDASLIKAKSSLLVDKRLLLIEPQQTSADIICRQLRSWQLKVDHCSDAEQAFKQANQEDYDIVLSEYHLGDSDGLTLAKHLREAQHFQGKFILMASSRHLKNQQELMDCGIKLILEKPITHALLHDILTRALTTSSVDTKEPTEQQPNTIAGTKTLVVEDNHVNQMVVNGLLKQLGIEADFASDGLEALSRYERGDYDLILMDCEMPEMDGYEASSQIRARERRNGRPAVVILALSAHARSDYQQRATEAGMNGYLTKPITLGDLSQAIKQYMRAESATAQAQQD